MKIFSKTAKDAVQESLSFTQQVCVTTNLQSVENCRMEVNYEQHN